MKKNFTSSLVLAVAAIGLASTVGPLAFGQVQNCQVTTQVPTGNPVAVLVVNVHVNGCFEPNPSQTHPCCSAAASINLPVGRYTVTLEGQYCSTECGPCNFDGTGACSSPAWLPIAWGNGSCSNDSRTTDACFLIDPRGGGGPLLINHPGGPFYAWRNDNYWGDNYGVETIRFYAVGSQVDGVPPSTKRRQSCQPSYVHSQQIGYSMRLGRATLTLVPETL
jgi:hypothetical protein